MPQCYICNSPCHYSNKCPRRTTSGGLGTSQCYNCGNPGHKKDRCPNASTATIAKEVMPKLTAKLLLANMWGENSALVAPESLFYILKMEIIAEIARALNIPSDAIDVRNKTPHINILGNKETYDTLHDATFIIDPDTFVIERNLVSIRLGGAVHYTILYWPGVGDNRDTVKNCITRVISRNVTATTSDIVEYGDCIICMSAKSTVACMPCRHMFSCEGCSARIKICAVCRSDIVDRIHVIMC